MAKKGDNFIGQTATAAGWGYTDKEEKLKPDVPHEAQFPVGECGSASGTDLLVCVDIVDGKSLARVRIVYTHLSPGVSLIYDLAHDSGILQSELFTSRSQNLVLAKLPNSGFWRYGQFFK